jgi:hypothetical protein
MTNSELLTSENLLCNTCCHKNMVFNVIEGIKPLKNRIRGA